MGLSAQSLVRYDVTISLINNFNSAIEHLSLSLNLIGYSTISAP